MSTIKDFLIEDGILKKYSGNNKEVVIPDEVTNSDKELFGTDRMIDALNSDVLATPKEVLRIVREAVDKFVGTAEQFDDLTMVCLEYRGTKE